MNPALATPQGADPQLLACRSLQPSQQRLQCFDAWAGAADGLRPPVSAAPPPPLPEFVRDIAALERKRPQGDFRFRIASTPQLSGKRQVLISAPALNGPAPRPVLTISCIDEITRLQLVVYPPLPLHQVSIQIGVGGQRVLPRYRWQVLEGGVLVDAGRGLAAIDVVRQLAHADGLQLNSDVAGLDGLRFDTDGLSGLLADQRQACRW